MGILLNKEEWSQILDLKDEDDKDSYILYYSLAGYKDVKSYLSKITELAKQNKKKVIAITPFLAFKDNDVVKHVYDTGPVEFLNYIRNAKLIVTDSYHGTLFSINFNKPFYSITDGSASHMRKNQIIDELGLLAQISKSASDLKIFSDRDYDYQGVNYKIQRLRSHSIAYLDNALSGKL